MRVVVRMLEGPTPPTPPTVMLLLDEPSLDGSVRLRVLAPPNVRALADFGGRPLVPGGVERLGTELLDRLRDHDGVRRAIDAALTSLEEREEPVPIYLRMGPCGVAEYPWECLFDAAARRFLALESRSPIGRITEAGGSSGKERVFTPPLRVLAILSAVGVGAMDEWRALQKVVAESPLDARLRILAGEPSVHEAVAAADDPRCSSTLLTDRQVLAREVREFDPHIVHLYCHGRADPPELHLGTPSDHAAGSATLMIEPRSMPVSRAWLAVLNCCDGARHALQPNADDARLGTVAEQLVRAGYPAAIGMREPIPKADAHLFTRYFYGDLFARLNKQLVRGKRVALEWAPALQAPRLALRDKYTPARSAHEAAATHRDWTRPVLYVRPAELRVERIAPRRGDLLRFLLPHATPEDRLRRAELVAEADELARLRQGLDPSTPAEALEEIDRRRDEVQRELRTLLRRRDPE